MSNLPGYSKYFGKKLEANAVGGFLCSDSVHKLIKTIVTYINWLIGEANNYQKIQNVQNVWVGK